MGKKEESISRIAEIEWDLFSNVQNRGGKASCQEDPETFKIIRTSNFMGWSDETLESYLNDLEEAKKAKRNLMTEKYARMEGLIKHSDPEKLPLIDKIVEIECGWAAEIAEKSPHLKQARPIYSSQDTRYVVSAETYARGELATYSKKTLEFYYKNLLELKSKNINGVELNYERMLKKFEERSR
jgi:hypothetical protein